MTFDREDQRELFLTLINESNFKGSGIEFICRIKEEVGNATVLGNLLEEKRADSVVPNDG